MMPSNHEGCTEDFRDPVVEEAFRILVQDTRASRGFHARVMTRIAAESPTLHDRLVCWLSPPWQPTWAGEVVTAADVSVQEQVFYLDDGEIQVKARQSSLYVSAALSRLPLSPSPWRAAVAAEAGHWRRTSERQAFTFAELRRQIRSG
jgi:hypothetical protein